MRELRKQWAEADALRKAHFYVAMHIDTIRVYEGIGIDDGARTASDIWDGFELVQLNDKAWSVSNSL